MRSIHFLIAACLLAPAFAQAAIRFDALPLVADGDPPLSLKAR